MNYSKRFLYKVFGMLLSVACLFSMYAPSVHAQSYVDDFEQATINSAWMKTEQYGTISLSTDQHKSGTQSVKLSSANGGQREIHLTQTLASPTKGTASIWFYDSAPGQQTLYSRFILSTAGNFVAGVYVQDYDGASYYAAGGGVGGGPTSVARSLGWHHFEIDTVAGKVRIDGNEVLTFPGDLRFDSVDLNLTGPSGRPNVTYYFDDFTLSPAATTMNLTASAPSNTEIYPGDPVIVNLDIQQANNLYAAQADCTADSAILEIQSGAFGAFFDPDNRLIGANQVNANAGTWLGAISQRSPAPPLTGNGSFASLTYQARNLGTTAITCDPVAADRNGFDLPISFSGTTITVIPFVAIDGTAIYQGRQDHAAISVTATGLVTRTATTNTTGAFVLDQLKGGSYTITADAPDYLPNCRTVNVTSSQGLTLTTTTLRGGDVNDDASINIGDATLVAASFGLSIPPADSRADINADAIVNIRDLAILAGNYELAGCQSW